MMAGQRVAPAVGFVVGVFAAGMVAGVAPRLQGDRGNAEAAGVSAVPMEVLHAAPRLVEPGEPVELAFEVVCAIADPSTEACAPVGTLYVAQLDGSDPSELALALRGYRTLAATVPDRYLAAKGFRYHAVIRDVVGGTVATVPPGGARAPLQTWVVERPTLVDVGASAFGGTREPDGIVFEAPWGSDPGEVGLSAGPEQLTEGPASFDVTADGEVLILDQLNDRLISYSPAVGAQEAASFDLRGAVGDLVVGDGRTWVLDHGGVKDPGPLVRMLDEQGGSLAVAYLPERGADMIRMGPDGPVVHVMPSDTWVPVTGPDGGLLEPSAQSSGAWVGRPIEGGRQVVLKATARGAMVAVVRGTEVERAWRIVGPDGPAALGEVQLAEPYREGLLVVLRVYTENRAEFQVLHLGKEGLISSFAVEPWEWANMSALSRFRLLGDDLYQMRSSPKGIEIVRFSLGGEGR